MSREAAVAARWLQEPQEPICNQPVGLRFHIAREGTDPGDLRFRPQVVGVVHIWIDFYPGMRTYPLQVRRDFDIGQRGNSRRMLAP